MVADRIFYNGVIHTFDDMSTKVEALAVRAGTIVARGPTAAIMSLRGAHTMLQDLQGKTMLPGFIDSHSHLAPMALALSVANLFPSPRGSVSTVNDALRELARYRDSGADWLGEWIVGVGYDDMLTDRRQFIFRRDLDTVSHDRPVLMIYRNGHMVSVNSYALERAGITAETSDPAGGRIQRVADSREPNGILEENAIRLLADIVPLPSPEKARAMLEYAFTQYAAAGITTVQDGAAIDATLCIMRACAQHEAFPLDVVAYRVTEDIAQVPPEHIPTSEYQRGFRIGGAKLIVDGSIQGYTAYLTKPYYRGTSSGYCGYSHYSTGALLSSQVAGIGDKGWQLLMHANGDAAIDQCIAALKNSMLPHDHRTVLIHAQTIREDQLDELKLLGVIPSFFIGHVYYWGDRHRDIFLGAQRAERISPLHSALARSLPFTLHTDAPVTPLSVIDMIWYATNRITSGGKVLGAGQRISVLDALCAVTRTAAWQYGEEQAKGTLAVGKRADLVVLSDNPLTVPSEHLRDIQVLETIKDGKTIFSR